MKLKLFFARLFTTFILVISCFCLASEADSAKDVRSDSLEKIKELTAIEYLQRMQRSYKSLNYEMLYLNGLQNQLDPKQLIHGVIDGHEVVYFRFLNGAMRESLLFSGKTSYFEQGSQSYTLPSSRNRNVFSNIANFDYKKGQENYNYTILGKGRIAGKKTIAIRMISKDEYRYGYIIWLDVNSYLPLRLDTLNNSILILDQVMVVSLRITERVNPWLKKITQQPLPQLLQPPQAEKQSVQWKAKWLPDGFKIVKNDQHKLMMYKNELVSYLMLNDGLVSVSIYIAEKKIELVKNQKIIQRGSTVLYTYQKGNIEINVIGDIPVVTAKRLIESIVKVKS